MTDSTSTARERFIAILAGQFIELFKTPAYSLAARRWTPEALAQAMTDDLGRGSADKDGAGVKATCKVLGVKCTYKAIAAFLKDGSK